MVKVLRMKRAVIVAATIALSSSAPAFADSILGTWNTKIRTYTVHLRIVSEGGGQVKGSVLSVSPQGYSAGAPFLATGSAKEFKFRFKNGNRYVLGECAEGICGKFTSFEGWSENIKFRLSHR